MKFISILILLFASLNSCASLQSIIDAAISNKTATGAQSVVIKNAKTKNVISGTDGREVRITEESLFDLASLTKVIVTAPLIMTLVDDGKISLETKISSLLPLFDNERTKNITIHHLLSHTSGIPAYFRFETFPDTVAGFEEILSVVVPSASPDKKFEYSDLNYILLGIIIEKLTEKSLSEYFYEKIAKPLLMENTFFVVPDDKRHLCVLTMDSERACLPHDPIAYRYAPEDSVGHAGLFSTATDLAKFTTMLLSGGLSSDGIKVINSDSVKALTETLNKSGRANGFDVSSAYITAISSGFVVGKGFGHTGYTGTSIYVDIKSKTQIILLTNRVFVDDIATKAKIKSLRTSFTQEVAETK
jgi:CubicO group peptidase (beta-lactamase class C family)